jgi:hypothetical protein
MPLGDDVYERFVDAAERPILLNCAVLYLDVLAIRAHSLSPHRQDVLRELLSALSIAREEAMVEGNEPWQALTWFTDNVVVAFPIMPGHVDEEPALGSALRAAAYIQLRLAISGFLARGGISFGEIHMAPHVAFGPALIEAVDLEKSASSPRVLLSDYAVELQKKVMKSWLVSAPQEREMAIDEDGLVFVDYLNFWIDEEDDERLFRHFSKRHAERIADALTEHAQDTPVRAKYEWLATYHNWATQDWPNHVEIAIPEAAARAFGRILKPEGV